MAARFASYASVVLVFVISGAAGLIDVAQHVALHRQQSPRCAPPDGLPPALIFLFAGRQDRMSVLMSYANRLLDDGSLTELHVWDLTKKEQNATYVSGLRSGRSQVMKPDVKAWLPVYRFYSRDGHFEPACSNLAADTYVFMKADDDVVFIDTLHFPQFIRYVQQDTTQFIVHANVVNSAVSAYYQYNKFPEEIQKALPKELSSYPRHHEPWYLVGHGDAALKLHEAFLRDRSAFSWDGHCIAYQAPDVAKGQGRFSINFFATRQANMDRLFRLVLETNGDDELALTVVATEKGLKECFFPGFNVAHLSFGPQGSAPMCMLGEYKLLADSLRVGRGDYSFGASYDPTCAPGAQSAIVLKVVVVALACLAALACFFGYGRSSSASTPKGEKA